MASDFCEGASAGSQFTGQFTAVVVAALYCAIASIMIVLFIKATTGLRVSPDAEREGLDLASHGETGYNHKLRDLYLEHFSQKWIPVL